MYDLFLKIVDFVDALGYLGIFIMTFIEGTFIPIPSEITLLPAGYLIAKGTLKLSYVLFWAIFGTVGGALFSYGIAYYFGRMLFSKYSKYLLVNDDKLVQLEKFFAKHGNISAFIGRVLPGIKHFISFPAGLGKMNVKLFALYSAVGGSVWVTLLVVLGYFIGDNEHLINRYIKQVNIGLIVFVVFIVGFYIWKYRRAKLRKEQKHTRGFLIHKKCKRQ